MKISNGFPLKDSSSQPIIHSAERLAMTYSMDALIPGIYVWAGRWTLTIGGSAAEENYSGMIHQPIGLAIVLPGYRILSTYQGSYDPR